MDETSPYPERDRLVSFLQKIADRTGSKIQKKQAETLGLSQSTWSQMINGKRIPERRNVETIITRMSPALTPTECRHLTTLADRARQERDSAPAAPANPSFAVPRFAADSGFAVSGVATDSGSAVPGVAADSGSAVPGVAADSGFAVPGSTTDSGFAVPGSMTDSGFAVSGSTADSGFAVPGVATDSGIAVPGTGAHPGADVPARGDHHASVALVTRISRRSARTRHVALLATAAAIAAGVVTAIQMIGPDSTAPVGAAVCDRYEVTAKTLSLRLPDGTQTGSYFVTDEVLAVQRRNGGTGSKYWYVSGNGRSGWVLPSVRYWRPLC